MANPLDDAVRRRLDFAISIGREAGRHTLSYFRQPDLAVERKSDRSPVTVADREAELLMRRRISTAFADDAILGEEFGEVPGTSGFRWILDPIDGTKSFIGGVPLYSTLIGVEFHQEPVLGFIGIPALDELAFAAVGQGAFYCHGEGAPRPARVSERKRLGEGIFVTSQVDSFDARGAAGAFRRLQGAAYVTRTWGDAYGYLLVATGRVEVMVDPIMNLWDAAAILPVVVEAGGTFTDWQGRPTTRGGEGVATNGHVLDEVLAITREFPKPS